MLAAVAAFWFRYFVCVSIFISYCFRWNFQCMLRILFIKWEEIQHIHTINSQTDQQNKVTHTDTNTNTSTQNRSVNYAHNRTQSIRHSFTRWMQTKQTNKLQINNIKIMFMFCSTSFDLHTCNKYMCCRLLQIDRIEERREGEKREKKALAAKKYKTGREF